MRALAKDLTVKSGKVELAGWVNSRRDHGGLIFIDLRDHTGVIQLVVDPKTENAFNLAESLRDEFVIRATGTVRKRGEGLTNPNIPTGDIEVVVEELTLLNRCDPLPVNTHDEGTESSEEMRLRYRYLDLRRPSMQHRLARRAKFYKFMRDYMEDHDFIEVTTPILANSSPEGARDFIIPSRLHPGQFYALPQAPQQFKQLLMVGGLPRYYQIAPCFRDEDPRADRLYGDFYQLDLEMSFVDSGEEVRQTMEPLLVKLATEFAGKKIVTPEIRRIPYVESMEKYGVDKPDLRYGMELIDLTDDLKDTKFSVFTNAECVKAICVKGGADLSRSQIDGFTEKARKLGAGGLAYLTYTKEGIKSPIAKFLSEAELNAITEKTGAEAGDAVFFGADKRAKVNKVLGQLRIAFADHFNLKNPDEVALCWIVDFPFYEWDDGANKLDFGHNPFSMPKGGLEALEAAKTDEEKLAIVADQYDMVMNGYEICSGAVRNYNPEIMYKVFGILGYDKEYVEARFGGALQKVLNVKDLASVDLRTFEANKQLIENETERNRAEHVVYECARTVEACKKLRQGDLISFGRLMDASHDSLRDLYAVSCKELDTLVNEARACEGVLGARMTGAGFGGCAVAIVNKDAVKDVMEQVGAAYEKAIGYPCAFYVASIGGGPREL